MAADLTRGGQFALIPAKVLYDDQLPATAKLLYGEIFRLSHANGFCYASNRDFMAILQVSEATVSRLIGSLTEQKHIRVRMIRRHGATGDIVQRRIFCGLELAQNEPEEGEKGILKNEDTVSSKMRRGILKNEDTSPYIENNKKKKKKEKENPPPFSPEAFIVERVTDYAGDDAELASSIFGLLENRAVALKKPVCTLRALNGILGKLDRESGNDRAAKLLMLENATTGNWLTVYALKEDEKKALRKQGSGEEDFGWQQ